MNAFPTGDPATSVVLLERFTPPEVRLGAPFEYTVRITNLTNARIADVVVTEQMPDGLNVTAIQPEPGERSGRSAVWRWDALGPREKREFRVSGAADRIAELMFCATVTFNTVACSSTQIVEPQLVLTKTAPPEVLLCDPIELRFVVGNTGSGVAQNVRITDQLPTGWTTADGRNAVTFDAGDLSAAQQREFAVTVRASQTGTFTNTAMATESGGLTSQSSATTVVRKPSLVVSKTGPAFRYLGRPGTFTITVANQGDAPARDTVLVDPVPAGTQFTSASEGGQYSGGRVTWNLGTLQPGASKSVEMTITPTQIGTIRNTAAARAYCAEGDAEATMEVRGIPAVLLEVVDQEDPDEIGTTEVYAITVTNQGSADGTNIRITCEIQPEAEYVSSDGPTQATVAGRTVTFAPLPRLAPKAQATFRVVVRGTATGDTRFGVSLMTDEITSPVTETESTRFYE